MLFFFKTKACYQRTTQTLLYMYILRSNSNSYLPLYTLRTHFDVVIHTLAKQFCGLLGCGEKARSGIARGRRPMLLTRTNICLVCIFSITHFARIHICTRSRQLNQTKRARAHSRTVGNIYIYNFFFPTVRYTWYIYILYLFPPQYDCAHAPF